MYSLNYSQPTTYASTNPFLTGAYLSYSQGETGYGDKFNTISSTKDKPFSFTESCYQDTQKYSTLNSKSMFESGYSSESKYNTLGSKFPEKSGYSGTSFDSDLKYTPLSRDMKGSNFDVSPNVGQNTTLLGVEDTPTPTSSIETEDSNTREVGEKDVEGDGEQSD